MSLTTITSTEDPAGHLGLEEGTVWVHTVTGVQQIWTGSGWQLPETGDSDSLEEDSPTE